MYIKFDDLQRKILFFYILAVLEHFCTDPCDLGQNDDVTNKAGHGSGQSIDAERDILFFIFNLVLAMHVRTDRATMNDSSPVSAYKRRSKEQKRLHCHF